MKVGPRRIIAAADKTALALGLRPGLTVAHAQALVPELHIAAAKPEEEDEGLARLATWCLRYSPLVAADRPDGVDRGRTGSDRPRDSANNGPVRRVAADFTWMKLRSPVAGRRLRLLGHEALLARQ